ncbi:MAG: hypothetical protein PHQ43_08695 [Dehalococcoidales bacterium]|nr:hypothetical protein [Dehalococcoidales bacterium]
MSGGSYSRAEIQRAMDLMVGESLPGRPEQSIYEQSTVPNFTIGAKRKVDDRTFRYSGALAALAGLARLVVNSNFEPGCTGHENEDGYEGSGVIAAVGDRVVDIPDTALRAKDYYQGGKLVIYGTAIFHQHHVVGSEPGDGTKVRLYLLEPISTEAVTVGMGVTAYRSPCSAVAPAGSVNAGFEPFVGLNLIPVDIGKFFWLQTAGPCIVTPTGGTWPGSAANLRQVYPNPADGTIQPATLSDPSAGYQPIGYLLSATVNTYGDLWIMLQLDN